MRVAITGATGNVGTALLRRLAREPDVEVVGIARRCPPPDAGQPYDLVRWHAADLGDPACLHPLAERLAGVDAVVHLAWQVQPGQHPARLRQLNLGGSRHVLNAMLAAGVPKLVHASSITAYAPAPADRRIDEDWPVAGVGRFGHGVDKAAVEAMLTDAVRDYPVLRVTRLRTAPVLGGDVGAEVARHFLGRFTPVPLLRSGRLPVVPRHRRLRIQVVHADDVAEAYLRALHSDRTGAFNIAAEPVVGGGLLAAELGGWAVPLPLGLVRLLTRAGRRARPVPVDGSWPEPGASVPLLDCSRAERELGWRPRRDARETLRETLAGTAAGPETARPETTGPPPRPAERVTGRQAG
ncbi:NAD-dependent epimerase/dehydratase family protein [Micromonospora sp. WMMD1102]|uniref:NAD-dependent epimerase/dehydratase family protein n=1 Tax=Micromonospora sp. WMMD1102 TaxID=3016105 RepID=UPI00241512FB|nr:NAD-dependent epimerase/dehydratase family protein [Micromonospora sp. WMMD1102]MDG4790680.1 NAD-dependent epimerase/dehydratase family protein [Micromonospora sp. WMMD1102]